MRVQAFVSLAIVTLFCSAIGLAPASAEVRFGRNVSIGGHDFSNQTFDRKHRAVIHLYDRPPRHAGCRTHGDRSGGETKVCHLQTLHRS